MRMHHFSTQNGPFAQSKIFFGKKLLILFSYLLASFIVQNFLRADTQSQECTIFGPKIAHFPKQ